jgi:hypothetical protein
VDAKMKAWILFNKDGEPEFIDSTLTEEQFKSWNSKYFDRGWTAELCEITRIQK